MNPLEQYLKSLQIQEIILTKTIKHHKKHKNTHETRKYQQQLHETQKQIQKTLKTLL